MDVLEKLDLAEYVWSHIANGRVKHCWKYAESVFVKVFQMLIQIDIGKLIVEPGQVEGLIELSTLVVHE